MTFAGKSSLGVRGERPARRATKIRSVEPDRLEHRLNQGNVDRMTVVGSGGDRQLDRAEQGACLLGHRRLKRLGGRSKVERPVDVPGPSDQIPVRGHHRHRTVVERFDQTRAGLCG